ncbi:MAG: hypothetical protein ACYC3B_05625 [Sedimentisphaerales bacterium]
MKIYGIASGDGSFYEKRMTAPLSAVAKAMADRLSRLCFIFL